MIQTTSTDWRDYVRPLASPGLSTCIEDGRLRLAGVRIAATWIDVVAMRLVERAAVARRSIVLVSPDPYDLLVPFTAAAMHIWRMMELQRSVGGYPHTDVRIAVVTSRIRLRTAYRQLAIETAKLFDAVPAATRLPTGDIAVLGGERARGGWGTLFVTRPSELRLIKELALVIVDLPTYEWEVLEDLPAPKILIGHDPADRLVQRLRGSVPIFAWNAADLRAMERIRVCEGPALAPVAARLERLARGTTCGPVAVAAPAVCDNAWLFWNDIGAMHRAARGSHLGKELANEAHVLFQDLMHLALPTAAYEGLSGTSFATRLRDLRHDEFQVRGELRELYLPAIHAALAGLHQAIGARSPKTDAMLTSLRECALRRQDVMLVARTAAVARVYGAYLGGIAELKRVRVTSLGAVGEEPPADVAVLTGLAPAWARHIYASGIASEIRVLSYATTRALPVEDAFVEVDHVERTIGYQHEHAYALARPSAKARCWEELTGEHVEVSDTAQTLAPARAEVPVTVAPPAPPDVPPGLWELDLPALEIPDAAPAGTTAPGWRLDRPAIVRAIRVVFDDGRWVWLEQDSTVTKFDRRTQRSDAFDVSRLAVRDELLFLDGDARKDVLAKVIEVAKEIPRLAGPAAWVEYWRNALRHGKQKFGTYTAFGSALEAQGCERETQTVRLWVVGTIIGPKDPMDVRRVGEVLADAPLRDHYRTIYGGIEQFRNAHAQLMQRVGALALRVVPAASAGTIRADELIDERSGLTASDFQGCVEIVRVHTIGEVRDIPTLATGRLRDASEREEIR